MIPSRLVPYLVALAWTSTITLGALADDVCPLATTPAWTIEGGLRGYNLGHCVRAAGDVNGDGYGDVVVGEPSHGSFLPNEGAAYVFHGSATGLSATAAWSVTGGVPGIQLGTSVCGAGDVNGDGYDDVIVGAPFHSQGETNEGMALLYLGSAGGLAAAPAWSYEPNHIEARLGSSVSRLGDVNGDGYDDVIVGALRYTNGETDEGAAFAFHGSAAGLSSTPAWSTEGNNAQCQYGSSLAAAGDVNGDGYADAIVGARLFSNGQGSEGRVFVFHGSASGLSPTANWTTESNQANAWYAWSVAGAGDVNGDGIDDVIIGALLYDNPESNEGRLYAYHGSPAGLSATASWTVDSNQASAFLGGGVSGVGDLNQDGYGDVIASAYQYTDGETLEGAAFAYLGSSSGLATTPAWAVESDNAGARFGYSISTAGDVDGDGLQDVIVGAPQYSNGADEEGAAFLYHAVRCNSAPVALCHDLVIPTADGCSAMATAADVDGGSFDPDGAALFYSLSPPGPYPLGITTVTLTVTDPQGLSDSELATVTVEDKTPPTISCPPPATFEAGSRCSYAGVIGQATATDDCTPPEGIRIRRNGPRRFPIGVTTVTWSARDAAGNTATCTQQVTVVDRVGPVLKCPSDRTVKAGVGCVYRGSIGRPRVSDSCASAGAVVVTNDAPAAFPVGVTTVTWKATDAYGNTTECQQRITVLRSPRYCR